MTKSRLIEATLNRMGGKTMTEETEYHVEMPDRTTHSKHYDLQSALKAAKKAHRDAMVSSVYRNRIGKQWDTDGKEYHWDKDQGAFMPIKEAKDTRHPWKRIREDHPIYQQHPLGAAFIDGQCSMRGEPVSHHDHMHGYVRMADKAIKKAHPKWDNVIANKMGAAHDRDYQEFMSHTEDHEAALKHAKKKAIKRGMHDVLSDVGNAAANEHWQ